MRDIGNIVAATGATSQERLEGVTVAITQMISKQKVSAEEMEQLAERGVNGFQILAQATGKTQKELRALAEQGKISADTMIAAFQRISQEKFGDAMEKQSKTFSGSLANIKDVVLQSSQTMFDPLYKEFGKIAFNAAKEIEGQKGDLGKIGVTLAQSVAEGFGVTLRELLNEAIKDAQTGNYITPQQFGAQAADAFLGDTPSLREYLGDIRIMGDGTIKVIAGITEEQKRANRQFKEGEDILKNTAKLLDSLTLEQAAGFLPILKDGNVIKGLDTVTNTIREINVEVEKLSPLDLKLNAASAEKEAKSLNKIIDDLVNRVVFYGQESEVAAVKQRLIAEGITDFESNRRASL
jgi:tape measure domain-containing protein